jgi:hypothetical protein
MLVLPCFLCTNIRCIVHGHLFLKKIISGVMIFFLIEENLFVQLDLMLTDNLHIHHSSSNFAAEIFSNIFFCFKKKTI